MSQARVTKPKCKSASFYHIKAKTTIKTKHLEGTKIKLIYLL